MSGDLGQIVPYSGRSGSIVMPDDGSRAIGSIVANITIEERHTDELHITEHPVESGAAITDHAFKVPSEVTIRCAWSTSPQGPAAGSSSGTLASPLSGFPGGSVASQLSSPGAVPINGGAGGNLAVSQLTDIFGAGSTTIGTSINSGTGRGTSEMQDIYQQLLDLQSSRTPFTVYTGKRKYDNMLLKSITVETDVKTENSLSAVLVCREIIIVNVTETTGTDPVDQVAPEKTNGTTEVGTKVAEQVQPDPNGSLANGIQNYVEPFSQPFNPLTEVTTVIVP